MTQNYNYKGALQEHFAKNGSGITPEYGILRRDGLDHSPTFTCYVRLGNKQAEGTARAKKDAEQEAAKNMMKKLGLLQDSNISSLRGSTPSPTTFDNEFQRSVSSPSSEVNSIARLQELCQSPQYNLSMPIYDESGRIPIGDSAGNCLSDLFSTTCKIGELPTYGKGRNKKESKQDAAAKMLQRLEGLSEDYDGTFLQSLYISERLVDLTLKLRFK